MSQQMRQELVDSIYAVFNPVSADSQRSDLLDESKTNTDLIAIFHDLCVVQKRYWGFTAIHSDHHDDSGLAPGPLHLGTHQGGPQGGYGADGWFLKDGTWGNWLDADDPEFTAGCKAIAIDPYDYQEGEAGSALTHANIVAAGSGFFTDEGGDHIHVGVK